MPSPGPRLITLRSLLAVTGALMLAALTGCGLTPDSSEDSSTSTNARAVSTTVPDEPVTLTLAYADDPPTKGLIEGFEQLHPQVTIKPQFTQFNDYVKSIKLAMGSDDAPDIAEYNPGAMRALIPAGLVLNLDPYEEAYGWAEGFPESSLDVLRTDRSAKRFGTGSLYAVPGGLSVVGVYYNKKLAAKAGITAPPRTLAEFEAALAKAKSGGVLPLAVGGLDVGALHLWSAIQNVLTPVDQYRDWVFGTPGSTIVQEGPEQASQKLIDWSREGYIPKSANGTDAAGAMTAFTKGTGVFMVTGNWYASAIAEAMGDDVGFFVLPGTTPDAPAVANGASVAYAISSKTEHPDVAAAFLDYLRSPEAAKIQAEGGFMPVNVEAAPPAEGLQGEIAGGFKAVVDNDGILPFPDFAAPSMLDALTVGVQGLIGGGTSATEYLESLQDVWNRYHGT